MEIRSIDGRQKIALTYLYMVPPAVAAIGFGVGHVSYLVYLPLWLLNSCLMLLAVRWLVPDASDPGQAKRDNSYTGAALLLIIPWLLFAVFAGMGLPPVTMAVWLATATEQQVRYTILMIGGCIALVGFAVLKARLRALGDTVYSTVGFAALKIAIPLFLLNMAFWGYYLTEVFKIFVNLPVGKRPDWYPPIKLLFYVISVVEVVLIYFATIFFAAAMKKTGILSKRAYRWYLVVSVIAILLVILPPSVPEPFATPGYLVSIPAIPFIMPYLMGVKLLRYRV